MTRILRPRQANAIAMLRQSIGSGKRRPMVQAPCGFGKTVIAAKIVESALAKGNRVLFTVPALSLIDQTVERFREEGITEIGVIQGYHEMTNWDMPVQVASVQTLMRRKLPDANVAIVDEAHRMSAFYDDWFNRPEWKTRPIIGLSATPWSHGLGKRYDDLLIPATIGDLIDEGLLVPFKVFAPSHPDLTNVKDVAGDYHQGDLSEVMSDKVIVADVVQTWLERAERRPTLCFAVDRAHARHLAEAFEKAGVKSAYADANTTRPERKEIELRLQSGEINVVVNVGIFTTGTDWPFLSCIILAVPTRSEMKFVQCIGRGLRTAEGKQNLTILDHSDTHLRLGLVTDIHHDQLSMGTWQEKEAREAEIEEREKPRLCKNCAHVMPPATQICPACGHVHQHKKPSVHVRDGELVEFTSRSEKPASIKPRKEWSMDEKASFLAQLKNYCASKSYAEGWSARKFRDKFAVWPDHSIAMVQPAAEITPEVAGWIRSENIRWAKSKSNPRNAARSNAA